MADIRLEKRTIQERLIIAKTLIETALSDLPTAEPNDEEAFEAGYTKAQMELKDAYKPKKGKWMQEWRSAANGYTRINGYKCSGCTVVYPWKTNYCPSCGARMEN